MAQTETDKQNGQKSSILNPKVNVILCDNFGQNINDKLRNDAENVQRGTLHMCKL